MFVSVFLIAALSSVSLGADTSAHEWLSKAAIDAQQIDDPNQRMLAWWRVADLAAQLGDDQECAKAVENAQRDILGEDAAAQMWATSFALRYNVLAKIAAGKIQEAEALVPPPASGRGEDTPRRTAQLAFVQGLARRGDVERALKEAAAIPRGGSIPYGLIAQEQARKGDKTGAVATSRLIIKGNSNPEQCQEVAVRLVRFANADDEAREVARLYEPYQDVMLADVAKAQAECGRVAEAEKTIALIKEEERKDPATQAVAAALVRSGKVDEGKKVAASMKRAGGWETNEELVRAAMESGNWDGAIALARDLSPAGDVRLSELVQRTKQAGRLDGLAQARGKAEDAKKPRNRFEFFVEAARQCITKNRQKEFQPWVATLEQPSDRAAAYIGAAMGAAGIDPRDVDHPEVMLQLK